MADLFEIVEIRGPSEGHSGTETLALRALDFFSFPEDNLR